MKELKQNSKENHISKNDDEKFRKVEKNSKEVKDAVETMMEYRKKRILMPIVITAILIIICIFCSTIFALVNINNEKILNGIDISGLSKEEATSKIEEIYKEKKEKEIGIKYEDYTNTLNPTLLEVEYNINKAIDEAYKIGRKDNIFINNYEILFNLINKKNIKVEMTLNEEVANNNRYRN